MKALPLPSPKVLLLWNPNGTVGNSDSLTGRRELRFLISPRFCPAHYLQGPPVLPRMTSPACHPCYPGSPPIRSGPAMAGLRPASQPSPPDHRVGNSITITRLHVGSLPLQPAGLLGSLNEPWSGNLMLWVTPHTSLQLRGRTAELPRSDFNRQAMRRTRHTDVVEFVHLFFLSETSSNPFLP